MSREGSNRQKKRSYRAGSFAKSALACPSCQLNFEEDVETCPRCGFNGTVCVAKYPFAAPPMALFVDPAGYLTEGDRAAAGRRCKSVQKMFPQVRFSFCLVDLDEGVDLREFGFWMFNASPVTDEKEAEDRPWTILFLIDPGRGEASVTSGYAIEPYLRDEKWNMILRDQRRHFFARDFKKGLSGTLDGLDRMLWESAKRVMKKTKNRRRREVRK